MWAKAKAAALKAKDKAAEFESKHDIKKRSLAGVVSAATATKNAAVAGASMAKDKAVDLETKHQLADKTKTGFAIAATKAKQAAIKGADLAKSTSHQVDNQFKVSESLNKNIAKARAISPEERQRFLSSAGALLSVASLVTGSGKAGRTVNAGLAAVTIAGTAGQLSDHQKAGTLNSETIATSAASTALYVGGGAKTRAAASVLKFADFKSGGAISQTVTDMAHKQGAPSTQDSDLTVEVQAVVDSGESMVFELEGEQFEVVVPPGVSVGQAFLISIPQTQAGAELSEWSRQASQNPNNSNPGSLSQSISSSFAKTELGQNIAAARQMNQFAKDLGLTPQQAVQGAKSASRVAQQLGVTPGQMIRGAAAVAKSMPK